MQAWTPALWSACRIALGWIALPAAFCLAYVGWFGQSGTGAISHLILSTVALFPPLLVVLIAVTILPGRLLPAAAGMLVTAMVVASQAVFYSLLLMGLASWGRIPTLELLNGYRHQIVPLLHAVGMKPMVAIAGGGVLVLGCAMAVAWLCRNDWRQVSAFQPSARRDTRIRSARTIAVLVAVSGMAVAARLWSERVFHPEVPQADEPWYLVFETVPIGKATAQSLVFDRIGDQRRHQSEAKVARDYQPTSGHLRKNVVLITVDALRHDHMSIYGYGRKTTPYLDSLARSGQAALVQEARSACAESSCGLLSLLSGKQPHELVSRNFGLMEILQRHGYRSTMVLSGDHTNFYRLRDHYGSPDHYEDGASTPIRYANDDYALLERLRRLPRVTGQQPQFVFLHLMSVHGLGERHPEFRRWLPASSIYNWVGTFGTGGLESAVNFYDNGVLQADSVIRQALEVLTEKRYVQKDSLVLVTADHAESLGEHGIRTHAESLFDSVLRIPWLWIGRPPVIAENDLHVVQADFAPTVLTDLGIPVPPHMSGVAMQRQMASRSTFHAQPPLAAILRSNQGGRHKLIHDFSANQSILLDLKADPKEVNPRRQTGGETLPQGLVEELIRAGYGQFGAGQIRN